MKSPMRIMRIAMRITVPPVRAAGWRFALGIAAIPSSILTLGIWKFPESPRWPVQPNPRTTSTSTSTKPKRVLLSAGFRS